MTRSFKLGAQVYRRSSGLLILGVVTKELKNQADVTYGEGKVDRISRSTGNVVRSYGKTIWKEYDWLHSAIPAEQWVKECNDAHLARIDKERAERQASIARRQAKVDDILTQIVFSDASIETQPNGCVLHKVRATIAGEVWDWMFYLGLEERFDSSRRVHYTWLRMPSESADQPYSRVEANGGSTALMPGYDFEDDCKGYIAEHFASWLF